MSFGFIYLWWDTKRNLYYLGSHKGTIDDGYAGSNKRFQNAYKSRPHTFRRKILETLVFNEHNTLLERECYWLSMIKDEELHCKKYYNEKKVPAGGNIFETLTEEGKQQHKQKSLAATRKYWNGLSDSEKFIVQSEINKKRRQNWTKESALKNGDSQPHKKTAILTKNDISIEITNIRRFCTENGINYGNMKTLLRGQAKFKTCNGWSGRYV